MKNSILVIDDETDFLESIRRGLITSGFKNIRIAADPLKVAEDIEAGGNFDVALIDITMPGMTGIEVLELIKRHFPGTECIMVTALDEARIAVECLKKGAYDYLIKPVSREDLVSTINRALERKRLRDILDVGQKRTSPKLNNAKAFEAIVTRNDRMFRVLKIAELHAVSDAPILITGETGTGKELLARAVHTASQRSGQVFTPINMDALAPGLFDAEFFGHTKGAFTGAERDRAGYLESTHKGTLFLDEIGNLRPELQGKLLRVLQDGEFIKIGTSKPCRADVRIIAATNKDLDEMIAKNQFRKDLYYRLSGSWLHLPPLRERKDDIAPLISRFLEEFHSRETIIEPEAMQFLMHYDYPGNIRELKSIIKSALNLAQGQPVGTACLPHLLTAGNGLQKRGAPAAPGPVPTMAQLEKAHILKVYGMLSRNKAECARVLAIGINTLRRKLDLYGIN